MRDKTFEAVSIEEVKNWTESMYNLLLDKKEKVFCSVDYNLKEEAALIIQISGEVKRLEKLAEHCATLKETKKYRIESILQKIARIDTCERQRLTPIKFLATESNTDLDCSITSSPPLPRSFLMSKPELPSSSPKTSTKRCLPEAESFEHSKRKKIGSSKSDLSVSSPNKQV